MKPANRAMHPTPTQAAHTPAPGAFYPSKQTTLEGAFRLALCVIFTLLLQLSPAQSSAQNALPLPVTIVQAANAIGHPSADTSSHVVRFAAIGDLPYNTGDERNLDDVLQDIAQSRSQFIIHLGDIKSGSEYCGNDLLDRRIRQLEKSPKPLIYTVGDNEWTDCHRRPAGGFDPVERLQWLRKRAFATAQSLGQVPVALTQQAPLTEQGDTPAENMRWEQSGVLFVTFNVPGSNNNYWAQHEAEHPRNAEFHARRSFNETWLTDSVNKARTASVKALVLAFQGNPFERDSAEQKSHLRDGFAEWRSLLSSQLKTLGKPVLLLHGDTHTHRIDQSLRDEKGQVLPNVLRLEAFGFPFTRNWLEVVVDTTKTKPFDVFNVHVKRLLQMDLPNSP